MTQQSLFGRQPAARATRLLVVVLTLGCMWTLSAAFESRALAASSGVPSPTGRNRRAGNSTARHGDQTRLEVSKPATRDIAEGQVHSYLIPVNVGEFVHVAVDELGVTLKATLFDSNHNKLLETDAGGSAQERVSLSHICASSGVYRIEVGPSGKGPARGRYQITLEEQRKVARQDGKRIAVQAAFIEGARLYAQSTTTDSYRAAAGKFGEAQPLYRELGMRAEEAVTLNALGRVHALLYEHEKAIGYYEQALVIYREVKDRAGEGAALNNVGSAYYRLGQYQKAVGYHEQALAIYRDVSDRTGEGNALLGLGNGAGDSPGRHEKAVRYYQRALALFRQVKDRAGEGNALYDLGYAYESLTQYEKATGYYFRALAVYRDLKDRAGEGDALLQMGLAYNSSSRHDKAIAYYEQALAIYREVKDRASEGNALNNLGARYGSLSQDEKAIEYHEQALAISREVKNRAHEGDALNELGMVCSRVGLHEKAIGYDEQALAIYRDVKDRDREGFALSSLGRVYESQDQHEKAIEYYEQALVISREVKDRAGEGEVLDNLMIAYEKFQKPRVAIVYGKQAVNAVQYIRGNLTGLEKALQQSFLQSNEDTYHKLASLLISQGRLPEAQAVIELLKEREYSDFVRSKGDKAGSGSDALEMTEDEKRFQEISDHIIELGAERGALFVKTSRTPDEENRLRALEADMRVVRANYQEALDELSQKLGNTQEVGKKLAVLSAAQSFQKTLRDIGPGAVVLFTVVSEDKYQVFLVTPDVYTSEEYDIKAEDLRSKVFEFRKVLQDPRLDPLPLATDLYRILLCKGKIAEDLDKAGATTLMWSLDDALRYIPIDALYDGHQYLVERYKNALFTLASKDSLKDQPTGSWRAAGLGVSRGVPGFDPLPGVAAELRGIIRQDNAPAGEGVLPGTIKLDRSFDENALVSALNGHFPVVHIASHFVFRPGDGTHSFLLLGDNSKLDLEHLKNYSFEGVELLTLSACDTATGGADAKGKEVESFGILAQARGAEAVMATLWPVRDDSTRQLMEEFYRLRQAHPGVSKAEALRQAQLELLRGTGGAAAAAAKPGAAKPAAPKSAEPERSTKVVPQSGDAALFKPNPNAPFAHPFYWAPFILIGNWR
jgi:CHAT domain-containing protein